MSWYVILAPLLFVPLLALLRLVGCSLFVDDPAPRSGPDPDPPTDDDRPDEPAPEPRPVVEVADSERALSCPIDGDLPSLPHRVELFFDQPEPAARYLVTLALTDPEGETTRHQIELAPSSALGSRPPQIGLLAGLCVTDQVRFEIGVEVDRLDGGAASRVVDGECTSSGTTEPGAVLRFVWNDDGLLTRCLESP